MLRLKHLEGIVVGMQQMSDLESGLGDYVCNLELRAMRYAS
jgi:hypothetical protein